MRALKNSHSHIYDCFAIIQISQVQIYSVNVLRAWILSHQVQMYLACALRNARSHINQSFVICLRQTVAAELLNCVIVKLDNFKNV